MNDAKFQRIMGLYVYCMDYHTGQNSRLYRILSRIVTKYRPKLTTQAFRAIAEGSLNSESDLEWQEARQVYLRLEAKFQCHT